MQAFYKAMPSQNALITERMYQRSLEKHQKKLSSIRCSVDNKPPKHWKPKANRRNLKKERMMEERLIAIERENRILVEKMAGIMRNTKPMIVPGANDNKPVPKSLNCQYRQRKMEQIAQQNLKILNRIQQSQPTYSALKWEQESQRNREYLKNIVIFKDKKSQPVLLKPMRRKNGNQTSSDANLLRPSTSGADMAKSKASFANQRPQSAQDS